VEDEKCQRKTDRTWRYLYNGLGMGSGMGIGNVKSIYWSSGQTQNDGNDVAIARVRRGLNGK
jgi:hypothetical protein